jgi:hypothetical protein
LIDRAKASGNGLKAPIAQPPIRYAKRTRQMSVFTTTALPKRDSLSFFLRGAVM